MSDTDAKSAAIGYIWPSLLVVAISVLGFLQYVTPLETQRPTTARHAEPAAENVPDSFYTSNLRLWQDPLEAFYHGEDLPCPIAAKATRCETVPARCS